MDVSMNTGEFYVEKLNSHARIPSYAHDGDAGMDVYSAQDCIIEPGEIAVIRTGLRIHIPKGYEIQVRPRSGLSLKTRLRLPNSPGTIDSGYKDELCILIENTSRTSENGLLLYADEKNARHGRYKIRIGDRIAQIVPAKLCEARFSEGRPPEESNEDMSTDRGGGFGHSGVR